MSHKAVIEVNEEGTEAAAVTVLIAVRSGPVKPLQYICNRPFIFLIRNNLTGTTLFAGVIRKPEDLQSIS